MKKMTLHYWGKEGRRTEELFFLCGWMVGDGDGGGVGGEVRRKEASLCMYVCMPGMAL